MTFHEGGATSFGNVAESYDRVRPGPPPQALDWLVPAGCDVAVDLAAGTGLFTRALIGRAGTSSRRAAWRHLDQQGSRPGLGGQA